MSALEIFQPEEDSEENERQTEESPESPDFITGEGGCYANMD